MNGLLVWLAVLQLERSSTAAPRRPGRLRNVLPNRGKEPLMGKRTLFLGSLALAAGALAGGAAPLAAETHADAGSRVGAVPSASDFSARVDNPWFPLEPGTRYVY